MRTPLEWEEYESLDETEKRKAYEATDESFEAMITPERGPFGTYWQLRITMGTLTIEQEADALDEAQLYAEAWRELMPPGRPSELDEIINRKRAERRRAFAEQREREHQARLAHEARLKETP